MAHYSVPRSRGHQRLRSQLPQLIAFGSVGAFATAIQYAVLFAAVHDLDLRPVVGSTVGFVASATVNYLLNYHWTFRSRASHLRAASRFIVVALVAMGINGAVMALLSQRGHYALAQLVATAAVFAWTYSANSLWSFGRAAAPVKG